MCFLSPISIYIGVQSQRKWTKKLSKNRVKRSSLKQGVLLADFYACRGGITSTRGSGPCFTLSFSWIGAGRGNFPLMSREWPLLQSKGMLTCTCRGDFPSTRGLAPASFWTKHRGMCGTRGMALASRAKLLLLLLLKLPSKLQVQLLYSYYA